MTISDVRINPRYALLVSAGLWFFSLLSPALRTGAKIQLGGEVLALGWLGPLTGTFAWYGNVFWIVGAVLMAMGRSPHVAVSCLGFVLAATCLAGVRLTDDSGTSDATLMFGAYLWLASFLPQIAATLTGQVKFPRG
jgi:hypothetical protein